MTLLVLATVEVDEVPVYISENDQNQQTVVIQIDPCGAGGPSAAPRARRCRHVRERAVSVVVIETVASVCGDVKVFKAIVVIVPHRDTHAVARPLQPGLCGHIFEIAIGLLVKQAVPGSRSALLGYIAAGLRVGNWRAVDEEDIEATVVIVIEQRNARSHGLNQVLSGSVRSHVLEANAARRGDVCKHAGLASAWARKAKTCDG